jgi:UDP-N-acetylmuramoyl-L-alanyl-D-glutamate--2,6-diaminopimelate ligase
MGKAAALGSDFAVVTSDNPRSEEPLKILAEVEEGIRATGRRRLRPEDLAAGGEGEGYLVIPDRREAILRTVAAARPGDVILIAGKGHEDYQILGSRRVHFDDREEALAALKSRKEKKNF